MKKYRINYFSIYTVLLIIGGIINFIFAIFLLIDFISEKTIHIGLLICFLLFALITILTFLNKPYWLLDDKKVVCKTIIKTCSSIEWQDVERVELRYLQRMNPFVHGPKTIKVEAYVFISSSNVQKDDDYFENRPGYAMRVIVHQYIEEVIEKYFLGHVIDKRK